MTSRNILYISLTLTFLVIGTISIGGCSSSTSPTTPAGTIKFASPVTVDFGSVAIEHTRDTTVRLSNTGTDTLTLSAETVSDAEFVLLPLVLPQKLAPNAVLDLPIRFLPSDTSHAIGSLIVNLDQKGATSRADTIGLKGSGYNYHVVTGNTYTYTTYVVDSSGNKVVGSDKVTTAAVVATGLSFLGKSNVNLAIEQTDTTVFIYEPNGDVSLYSRGIPVDAPNGVYLEPGWRTLPLGTHATGVNLLTADTTAMYKGFPVDFHIVIDADYVGADSVNLASEVLRGSDVKLTITVTGSYMSVTEGVKVIQYFVYAPKLGYPSKIVQSQKSTPAESGTTDNGYLKTLTQYQIK